MTESTNSSIPTELTDSQKLLLLSLNEASVEKPEAVALLTLLNEQETEQVVIQLEKIAEKYQRLPTEQEIMEMVFPILKAKSNS